MRTEILSRGTVMENPESIFRYFGWPSVTRLPGGALAAVASGYRLRHVCPFGKAVISYSYNEGKTWTRPAPVIDTPLDDRDAGIVPFGKGRVILTSFNNSIAQQRIWANKPDDGAEKQLRLAYLDRICENENPEKYLGATYVISEDGGFTFGKVHISPVTSPHGPAATKDGGLLWVGRRFSQDDKFDNGAEPYVLSCRLNENDEFERIGAIENIPLPDGSGFCNSCEPHALILPDGTILVHIRVQGGGFFTTYQSVSRDGGRTFTKPRKLLADKGGAPAHLTLLPDGTILSVYGYREQPYGIRFMLSRDGGERWETDLVLLDDGESADLGYPCSVLLRDGSILTVYYENKTGAAIIRSVNWKITD